MAPHAVALVTPGGDVLTFAGLQNRIAAIAQRINAAGIRPDDVVALVLPDGAKLMAGFLGIASVARCAVLNPALRSSEIHSILTNLGARAVFSDPAIASPAGDFARERGIPLLDIVSCTRTDRRLPESPNSSQIALLLHTSATTGRARIVPLTHSNLRAIAANSRLTLNLTSTDRFLSMMPLFHLQGLMSCLAQLLAGGSVICSAGFDAGASLSWLEEYRPTWYTAGPTAHRAILPLIERHPDILERSPLRFVRSIGAPLPQVLMEHLERALHIPVLEGYGMTEGGAITSNTPHQRKPGSVGRTTGSEIGILGEAGKLLPPGFEGEIVVRARP